MDLHDLNVFATAARLGSVTKAAKSLSTVQSNVTARIRLLERELAVQLFDRTHRGITLTPKGDGTTEFAMREVFSGLMLPMIRGSLPDFGPAFETFARDLKRAAEGS